MGAWWVGWVEWTHGRRQGLSHHRRLVSVGKSPSWATASTTAYTDHTTTTTRHREGMPSSKISSL